MPPFDESQSENQTDQTDPIAELVRNLKDEKYATRYEAATALEKLGVRAEPAIPALIDALGDRGSFPFSNSDFVPAKASRTLTAIGRPAIPALIAAFRVQPDSVIRHQVLWTLGDFGRDAQVELPDVQAALLSETECIVAALTLHRIDPEGELSILTLVPKTKAPFPTLVDQLTHQEPRTVAWALKDFGPATESDLPLLFKLLTHEEPGVREGSVYVLRAMGPKAAPAVPYLLKALQDVDVSVCHARPSGHCRR